MTTQEKQAFEELLAAVEDCSNTYLTLSQKLRDASTKLKEHISRAKDLVTKDVFVFSKESEQTEKRENNRD